MFKLAIEVCFENYFGLIHAIFLLLGSTKSVYFSLGHPVYCMACMKWKICGIPGTNHTGCVNESSHFSQATTNRTRGHLKLNDDTFGQNPK